LRSDFDCNKFQLRIVNEKVRENRKKKKGKEKREKKEREKKKKKLECI
jgi:hypothetical protein